MPTLSHNARLGNLLSDAEKKVQQAGSQVDLLDQVQRFADFEGALEFDFSTCWRFFGAGLAFLIIGACVYWLQGMPVLDDIASHLQLERGLIAICFAALGFSLLTISVAWMYNSSNRLPSLSHDIARMSSFFHAGMGSVAGSPDYILAVLDSQFRDYRRGNFSREIQASLEGVYTGPFRSIPYQYFCLHYVNQRIITKTVPDGKGGTRTTTEIVYDHFDRYSLVVDFPWVTNIAVRSDGQSEIDLNCSMDTASPDFNRSFALTGQSEMACAKFTTPSTVLHLLSLFKVLSGFNLEFAETGSLCISFENDDLLAFETHHSLLNPALFKHELDSGIELPRLQTALAWVHRLTELHDDNFAPPPSKKS